jgi:hypothetical protein
MTTSVMQSMAVPRVAELTEEAFVTQYLVANRPVIVTAAMRDWPAMHHWTPERLAERFGSECVQVYGDLFRLIEITKLSDYLQRYFGKEQAISRGTRYVRWYCHLADDERVPWADHIFDQIAVDWSKPSFLPSHSYLLPYRDPSQPIDPGRDWFPARGLFISAAGSRTRLHVDPWCSDALLCQIYGRKEFAMYDPSQLAYLRSGNKMVDIEAPDLTLFPDFEKARPSYRDVLEAGEILLVPAGWAHHFKGLSDSVSLTWNFVHASRRQAYCAYVGEIQDPTEWQQLKYAYFQSPRHRPITDSELAAILEKRLNPPSR